MEAVKSFNHGKNLHPHPSPLFEAKPMEGRGSFDRNLERKD